MLKLLSSLQIREVDQHHIKTQSISSLDLMEAASLAFVSAFRAELPNLNTSICIYCGTGNNGGDGLAIARLLKGQGYKHVSVKIARFRSKESDEFKINFDRLKLTGIPITELFRPSDLLEEKANIIIDALIGSGLNRPLDTKHKTLITQLNQLNKYVVAVDVPSGFPTEGIIDCSAVVLKARLTLCFQRAKINFFFPESAAATERFVVIDIGLEEAYIQSLPSLWKLIEEKDLREIIRTRKTFSHKGTYGHALIIAGSSGTMGAALLCADACLHSGAGLTTACIPKKGIPAMNAYAPEIMTLKRSDFHHKTLRKKYNTLAIGPGLGVTKRNTKLLIEALQFKIPMVLDADALNILAANPDLLHQIPKEAIICPHMKEFDRLFGVSATWWERVALAQKKARELNIIIVLKNQYTFIILPDSEILINPTGNPAMAVGGMGDVLCGMIAAFLAQAYSPKEAAILACYIHGKAGDILNLEMGRYCIAPSELTMLIPEIIQRYCGQPKGQE